MIIVNLTNRDVFMKNSGILTIVIIMFLSFGCAKKGSDQAIIAKDVEQNLIAKEVWSETVTGMKFRKIPRKSIFFRIGSPSTEQGRKDDEKQHTLTVGKYWIAETEVTQKQWNTIMSFNPSKFKGDDLPVDSVSWNLAQKFIKTLNTRAGKKFRLPTEAEWELAARAGTTTARYWGEEIGENNANCGRCGDPWDGTAPVKSFAPNNFGLYDMLGNVWEWTCSEYKKTYDDIEQKCVEGAESYVLRGGALNNSAKHVRAANRARDRPAGRLRGFNCGFRLAMDSPNEEDKPTAMVEKEVKKATIYFDRTTKKWSLEKKDRNQPRYEGEIADGIPSGNGILYLPNGFYEGEFKLGKFNGNGKRLYFEKGKLVGEFFNNKAHGQGTYTYLDGDKYVGGYRYGKKSGQGTYTFSNGRRYEGEWKNNKKHGQGTFTWPNGNIYVGQWKNGNFHGHGKLTKKNGYNYVGDWKFHKEDGYGEKTWPDGDTYEGEFKNGETNGEGTYKWIEGNIYRGSFIKGDKHGKGTYTFTDGRRWVGEFRNEKIWNAKLYDKDGNVIEEFVKGVKIQE